MPGCLYRCPTISGSSFEEKWESLRYHYGPRTWATTAVRDDSYAEDLSGFVEWANENGRDSFDASLFGRWLNWRLSIGTASYGNLSTRIRDGHTGISCVPCPYSESPDTVSGSVWLDRSEAWLGFRPDEGDLIDHGNHYMKVASMGGVWGWECTSNDCSYYTSTGKRYFHG